MKISINIVYEVDKEISSYFSLISTIFKENSFYDKSRTKFVKISSIFYNKDEVNYGFKTNFYV